MEAPARMLTYRLVSDGGCPTCSSEWQGHWREMGGVEVYFEGKLLWRQTDGLDVGLQERRNQR